MLRCARNDVEGVRHTSASSRRITPELCQQTRPRKSEGAGNAGCPRHPQPVCIGSKHTVVTTGTPEHPAFSCAMVLTVSFVLSSATNSFLSPSLNGLTATSARLGRLRLRSTWHQQRMPGPHDFAVRSDLNQPFSRPCAARRVLAKALKRRSSARRSIAHRETRPAITSARQRCRVHRIPSRVRDDSRSAPLWGGTNGEIFLSRGGRQGA